MTEREMGTTEHTEKNFDPSNYEVVDYFDNRRPQYFGQSIEEWKSQIEYWQQSLKRVYGEDWVRKIHRCEHCHQPNVRYIAAVKDTRTNEVITFGDICVDKLGFRNRSEYTAAKIRAQAQLGRKKALIWVAYKKFLKENPEVVWAIKEIDNPIHENNRFAHDVIGKLKHWGSISQRQLTTLIKSLEGDYIRAEKLAEVKKGEFVGTIGERIELEIKCYKVIHTHNQWGVVKIFLMKDNDGNELRWFTSSPGLDEGERVKFKATVKKHSKYNHINQTILTRVSKPRTRRERVEVKVEDSAEIKELRERGVI